MTTTPSHTAVRRPRRSLTHPTRTGVLLVAPALLLVTVFALVPLAFALYISVTNWPLVGEYRFVGLDNYRLALSDPGMWKAIRYTLLYTAIVTVPILVLGYALAVLVRFVVGLTTLSYVLVLGP